MVTIVAEDGMPLTPNTLMIANRTLAEIQVKAIPTRVPPKYDPEEFSKPNAVPMPDYLKDKLRNLS